MKPNKLFLAATMTLILSLVLTCAGCGGFNAFKALGTDNKNIPDYKLTGNAYMGDPKKPEEVQAQWVTIKAGEDVTEENARKIAADYIEKNKELDIIGIRIETGKEIYLIDYYKDSKAAAQLGQEKNFKKWPAVSFSKEQKN